MIFTPQSKRGGLKLRDESFRRHVWAAIGSAAVGVVGGVIQAKKAKKNAKGQEVAYDEVDIQEEQKKAITGTIENQGNIEMMLSRSNAFTQGQANTLTEQAMPGYGELSRTLTDRATTMAKNPYDVPQEVEDNLARIAAERGISGGTRGQFNDFSLLRDFGVNQLAYGRENINQAQSLTGLLASIAPRVNPMSPMSFYVTPGQAAANSTTNNQTKQEIAQGGSNARVAASNAGSADMWANLSQLAGAAGAAYGNRSKTGSAAPASDPSAGGLF